MRLITAMLIIYISFAAADLLPDSDGLCQRMTDTLCVNQTLLEIAAVARSVNRTATEIDRHIIFKHREIRFLYRALNFEMATVQRHLPPPVQLVRFAQLSNVDKKYVTDVLLETHNALAFYYNSIQAILSLQDPFSTTIDGWLVQMADNMRDKMICRCRSVLHAYGTTWPRLDEVKGAPFSHREYQSAPSTRHDVQSMVIVRVVRERMTKMHEVLTNIGRKYYSIVTQN